jgi:manganese/zinc/iron transport system substrate-binding protein
MRYTTNFEFVTHSKVLWCTAAILVVCCIAGCDGTSAQTNPQPLPQAKRNGPYQIVTTTGMVTDVVRAVAGEHAEITALMGPGVDPHLYKPTRGDVKRLTEADVIIYSGLMLEGRMSETFTQVARKGKTVFAVTEGLDEGRLREPPEFAGHYDPHVWMDVALWSQSVDYIARMLSEYDPSHAAEYQQNATKYRESLKGLDDYVRRAIESIPEEKRVLVTAHDAFGYFSQAYGIEVRSVQGVTTESEAGVQDVNKLVDFLVERKIPAIFVESSVNSKNIEAVVEGCRARGVKVQIGGELFSDALGPADDYTGTYVGMLDANATRIARALGGNVPAGGYQGKITEFQPDFPIVHSGHDGRVSSSPRVMERRLRYPGGATGGHRRPERCGKEHLDQSGAQPHSPRLGRRAVFRRRLSRGATARGLCPSAHERRLGLSRHRAGRGGDGALWPHWLVSPGDARRPAGSAGITGACRAR